METVSKFFDSSMFMPHGHCFLWRPGILWLNVGSDVLIALSYLAIPAILFYFLRRRKETPFSWIFLLFGAFITLCGITHAIEIWTVWVPDYQIQGMFKLATGLVSAGTAVALLHLMPRALALKTPREREAVDRRTEELGDTNRRLQTAVAEYRDAVRALEETESKKVEKALQRAREDAEAASRTKSQYLANVSHEIRTPMTAILGYTDLLAEEVGDGNAGRYIETIRRNSRYLLDILNDILDLSKIEAGRLAIQRQPVAPDEIVAEVHSLMGVPAREKGIDFEVAYTGKLPQTISTDPVRLRQILVNLVSNAIKFTDEGGEVRLETRLLISDQSCLQFKVIDTGIGMSKAEMAHLFEPFAQAHQTAGHGGTGLGLAISRRLAELLGGAIHVESDKGKGSTFTVTIPTGSLDGVPLVEPRSEIAPMARRRLTPSDTFHLNGRFLIVDDDPDIQKLVAHHVEHAGGDVIVCNNGREALERMEKACRPFDVVIMDMQMPEMDGYAATRAIRAKGFRGPILALTAAAMTGERERCLEVGCSTYLSKPINATTLMAAVAGALDVAARDDAGEPRASRRDDRHRILLVEDNADTAEMLTEMLVTKGYRCRAVGTGGEALVAWPEFQPHVIICDLGLPDMRGEAVARAVHDIDSSIRIIAFTGNPGDEIRLENAGFESVLVKPASWKEIRTALEKTGVPAPD